MFAIITTPNEKTFPNSVLNHDYNEKLMLIVLLKKCNTYLKNNNLSLTGIEPGSVGFVSTTLVHIANPTGPVNGLVNILNIDIEHQYYDFSDKYSRVYTEYLLVSC